MPPQGLTRQLVPPGCLPCPPWPGLGYLRVTAGATQTVEAGLQDLVPGEDHGFSVIQQLGHDPGEGQQEVKPLKSPAALAPDTRAPPPQPSLSPQRSQQQGFIGPGGVQSPQEQEEGLALLLEALEEGPHSAPRAALSAQHALQVQEEFCRRAPHQRSDQQLRGPLLALGTGGLRCCCPDTREGIKQV